MITVLLFADQREKVGEEKLVLHEEELTVVKVKEHLLSEYPSLNLDNTMTAINEEYEDEDTRKVQANDVIAFIPPVSGG